MNRIYILSIFLLLHGCSGSPYNPSKYLSEEEQSGLIRKTIRYSAKIPPHSTQATKFNPEFDWYYENAAGKCQLWYYYPADSLDFYFIAREARSITPMKEGIGGTIKIDKAGNLIGYNEIFRTWKMPEDTLKIRGRFLFERLIRGGDLSMYYTKFQGDRYIEFPDEKTVFDQKRKRWIDTELDSLNYDLGPM
jgi:hypothetical protein